MLCRDATVLLCRRPFEKRHGGLWEFPGGKVHAGETPTQALARELQEELDLRLDSASPALATLDDPGSHFTIAFHPVTATGTPRALEHLEIAWIPRDQVVSYPLAPSDLDFVAAGFLEMASSTGPNPSR